MRHEKMAVVLHSMERKVMKTGKPQFPVLSHGPTAARKDMASLVTSNSWLVFNILGLDGPQDWLLTPATSWYLTSEFQGRNLYTSYFGDVSKAVWCENVVLFLLPIMKIWNHLLATISLKMAPLLCFG